MVGLCRCDFHPAAIYPIQDWEQELDRIEAVVKAYHKPFFFAEAGCMSRTGSKHVPNNWGIEGMLRLEEQVEWYTTMFESCRKREWMQGYGLWEWAPAVPSANRHIRMTVIKSARSRYRRL